MTEYLCCDSDHALWSSPWCGEETKLLLNDALPGLPDEADHILPPGYNHKQVYSIIKLPSLQYLCKRSQSQFKNVKSQMPNVPLVYLSVSVGP
jgi:hypothetical protein